MDFLNIYGNIWSFIESIAAVSSVVFASFLFLNDPLRRWKLLGFRPTVMVVLFDPKIKKILLIKSYEWGFNQGSIYGDSITGTVEDTLQRELGIDTSSYRIYFVNPLGRVRIDNRKRLKRIVLGSISLFPNLLGKGYIGCFVDTDLNKLKRKIKLGYGIEEFGIFTIKNAKKKISSIPSEDNPFKERVYRKLFSILNDLVNNWEIRRRSI
jgi:hypothetical protein